MTEPLTSPSHLPNKRCACGKIGWYSKADADQVVVNAKIRRALFGNANRREQRSYQCETTHLWHATSSPYRAVRPRPAHDHDHAVVTGGAPEPVRMAALEYEADDDAAARDYLSDAIFYGDDAVWASLMADDRVRQTLRVLQAMAVSSLAEQQRRRDVLARGRTELATTTYLMDKRAYDLWLARVLPVREMLARRTAAVKVRVGELNIRDNDSAKTLEAKYLRAVVRRLALEIELHERTAPSRSSADVRLYGVLDAVKMPTARRTASLRQMMQDGPWVLRDDEHPLDGDVGPRPPK